MKNHIALLSGLALMARLSYAFDPESTLELSTLLECHSNTQQNICDSIGQLIEGGGGADPNAAASHNLRAIHFAAQWGDSDLILALAKKGAEINPTTQPLKWTPFHYAVKNMHRDTAILLLALGADAHAKASALWLPHQLIRGDTSEFFDFLSNLHYQQHIPLGRRIKEYANNKGDLKRELIIAWMTSNQDTHERTSKKYMTIKYLIVPYEHIEQIDFFLPKDNWMQIFYFLINNIYLRADFEVPAVQAHIAIN